MSITLVPLLSSIIFVFLREVRALRSRNTHDLSKGIPVTGAAVLLSSIGHDLSIIPAGKREREREREEKLVNFATGGLAQRGLMGILFLRNAA